MKSRVLFFNFDCDDFKGGIDNSNTFNFTISFICQITELFWEKMTFKKFSDYTKTCFQYCLSNNSYVNSEESYSAVANIICRVPQE